MPREYLRLKTMKNINAEEETKGQEIPHMARNEVNRWKECSSFSYVQKHFLRADFFMCGSPWSPSIFVNVYRQYILTYSQFELFCLYTNESVASGGPSIQWNLTQ